MTGTVQPASKQIRSLGSAKGYAHPIIFSGRHKTQTIRESLYQSHQYMCHLIILVEKCLVLEFEGFGFVRVSRFRAFGLVNHWLTKKSQISAGYQPTMELLDINLHQTPMPHYRSQPIWLYYGS